MEIIPSTFDETLNKSSFSSAGEYAAETALHKAIEVSRRTYRASDQTQADIVIGADTVVELEGMILEKPTDEDDAAHMLFKLSGRQHRVFTGVSLIFPSACDPVLGKTPLVHTFWEETSVDFGELKKEAIEAYVRSGEPMDKAGAYGIQGIGGSFVKSVTGCFYNVVGFPLYRFSVELDKLIAKGALCL
ncbi:hypothetical protein KP509_13G050500 [Ceratopteris richardii]|nr:hypothetical protein KP509_13G050500 [Ceratopteris richardii]